MIVPASLPSASLIPADPGLPFALALLVAALLSLLLVIAAVSLPSRRDGAAGGGRWWPLGVAAGLVFVVLLLCGRAAHAAGAWTIICETPGTQTYPANGAGTLAGCPSGHVGDPNGVCSFYLSSSFAGQSFACQPPESYRIFVDADYISGGGTGPGITPGSGGGGASAPAPGSAPASGTSDGVSYVLVVGSVLCVIGGLIAGQQR